MADKLAYIEYRPGLPLAEQRRQALAWGCPPSKVYEAGKEGVEHVDHFVQALRKGSEAGVAGLHVLGTTRGEISRVLRAIQAKGATIVDWNNRDPIVALDAAYSRLSGMARIPSAREAKRRGRAGAKARWQGQTLELTEKHEAMWKDVNKYRTNEAALAAISKDVGREVTRAQMHYRFGASGRKAGWRPKKRKR